MTDCLRTIHWAGGENNFDLSHPTVLAIIEGRSGPAMLPAPRPIEFMACAFEGQYGSTIAAVLKRFENGVQSVSDVRWIIALGLYGAGMKPRAVMSAIEQNVDGKPLAPSTLLAHEILSALFIGAVNRG